MVKRALRPERVIIMNIISSGTTKLLYHCLFLYNKWQRDFRKGLVNPIDPIKGALMFSLVPFLMNLPDHHWPNKGGGTYGLPGDVDRPSRFCQSFSLLGRHYCTLAHLVTWITYILICLLKNKKNNCNFLFSYQMVVK